MKEIAVLIPTYKRHHKLEKFVEQFNSVSTKATLYFIVHPEDLATIEKVQSLMLDYIEFEGRYVNCINAGCYLTKEPFILFGADDIEFMPDWDVKLLELAKKHPNKDIFGGTDSWLISKTLKHISHPMIRRNSSFGVMPYNTIYEHYMCDIELIQSNYDFIHIEPETFIEHHHGEDETTKHIAEVTTKDKDIYLRRRHMFELWDTFAMQDGLLVPTMLNPEYHKKRLYVVVPSYKDTLVLKNLVASLSSNTYYPFTLIIINDSGKYEVVDPKNGVPYVIKRHEVLEHWRLEDQTNDIYVHHNEDHLWCGGSWNKGVEIAEQLYYFQNKQFKPNYIAVLNSDVEVKKDWDKYLVARLDGSPALKPVTIACPYQYNNTVSKPFAFAEYPSIAKHASNMINGSAFMFRLEDSSKLFPIPEDIKHWATDSVLSDLAERMDSIDFVEKSVVKHYVSIASRRVGDGTKQWSDELLDRLDADIDAYQIWLKEQLNLPDDIIYLKTNWIKKVIQERR